ncbi:MAG: GNAT family N-acetyltransferase [Georgenia sp.]
MTTPGDPSDDLLGSLLGGTDPDPHAGHAHNDPLRPTADYSVRPATADDARLLGNIHARTLRATLAAGTGKELAPEVAGLIDARALGESWAAAITAPPTPRHRVLTALAGRVIVGFAAYAPAEVAVPVEPGEAAVPVEPGQAGAGAATAEPGGAGAVAEILALEVPAEYGRRGHGSRLLAACADLLREQGARRVQTWAVQGDDARTRFLDQAGFAPAGLRRTLDVGGTPVTESCWYAEL